MRPSDLLTVTRSAIRARLPLLVVGPPGVGKSDVIAEAAREEGADLLISHPAVSDPTDAKGLPWAQPGATEATFLPFGDLAQAMRAMRLLVWFLDDLGQAAAAMQAAYMQLILARRVNGHPLPDVVTFIAASNRRTDKAGVSGILEPVKSRFASIVELEAHLDDWVAWAFKHDVPAELIAFLRFRPNLLCAFEATADLTNSPLPRTWAYVAKLLKLGMPHGVEQAAIAGAVGAPAAAEFGSFRRLFSQLPNIDAILKDPNTGAIPSDPATLYAVVTALGMRAEVGNFGKIRKYAERLKNAKHGEFAVLLVRDACNRDEQIMQTGEFLKVAASGDLGTMISGGA